MLAALEDARRRERRFLADASHELRTPLTSLAGNVDFLVRHGANAEVVHDLELDTRRLQRLVDDLLALERENAGPAPDREVRLDEVAAVAVAGRERGRVGDAEAVTVTGEPDALRRAVDNLLDNAEIHGPRDGEITVDVRIEGGEALLSVRDDGPGFGADEAAHAFDRFWRGRDAQDKPGSGLGLALVSATAQRHGGRVAIDGSTVTIVLPGAIRAPSATRHPGAR